MKKAKVVPMVSPETIARDNFSAAVQSVAFQLTLSRRMISMLEVVRDYGYPRRVKENNESYAEYKKWDKATEYANGAHQYIAMTRALQRRGLVIFNPDANQRKPGERAILLSRAGELTCELLVMAGLLQAPANVSKKQAR